MWLINTKGINNPVEKIVEKLLKRIMIIHHKLVVDHFEIKVVRKKDSFITYTFNPPLH